VVYVLKGEDPWAELRSLICTKFDLHPEKNTSSGARHARRLETDVTLPPEDEDGCSERCPPRVLVIDDDFTLAKTLKTRLEKFGLQVTRTYNGRQGYMFAVQEQPDVIITDFNMPEGRAD